MPVSSPRLFLVLLTDRPQVHFLITCLGHENLLEWFIELVEMQVSIYLPAYGNALIKDMMKDADTWSGL